MFAVDFGGEEDLLYDRVGTIGEVSSYDRNGTIGVGLIV
jgi:hypothetical protein